jgi:hypothetical protein
MANPLQKYLQQAFNALAEFTDTTKIKPFIAIDPATGEPLDLAGAIGGSFTAGTTLPTAPVVGDYFWDTNLEVLYKYIFDGTSNLWVDITTAAQAGQGGGLVRNVVNNPASPYTPNDGDIIIWDTTSGNKVLSLPAAASSNNFAFNVKKIDNTANTITVDPDGAELIEEGTTAVITSQYEAFSAVCDGTEWWVIAAI